MKSPAGEFYIKQSVSIAAREATVFALISDLRRWELWNPQLRADPRTKRTYSGAMRGTGAVSTWNGPRSGAGKLEITSATPSSEVTAIVNFERPFKVQNLNTFELRPDGSSTVVTWSMRGPKPFLAKLLGLVINMDKSLAKHFDAGLAQLKAIAESEARLADS